MVVLDTNSLIYLAKARSGRRYSVPLRQLFASITRIEALGFGRIPSVEQNYLDELFDERLQLDLDETVIERAVRLRQQTNMTLGDAIIGAIALAFDCDLRTANTDDVSKVDGLRLVNPLRSMESRRANADTQPNDVPASPERRRATAPSFSVKGIDRPPRVPDSVIVVKRPMPQAPLTASECIYRSNADCDPLATLSLGSGHNEPNPA